MWEGADGQEAQVCTRLCCPALLPVFPTDRAPLQGMGVRCVSAHGQVSKGIPQGDQVPEPSRSQCQQQLSLGHEQLLLNSVAQRKGKNVLSLPALTD